MVDVSYRVNTTLLDNGQIVQETERVQGGAHETVMRQVMDTYDEQIRQALIALGWTPPIGGGREPSVFVTEFLQFKDGRPELTKKPLSEWPSWAGSLRRALMYP